MLKWNGNEALSKCKLRYGTLQIRTIKKKAYTYAVLELVTSQGTQQLSQDIDRSILMAEAVEQDKALQMACEGVFAGIESHDGLMSLLKDVVSNMDIEDDVLDGDGVDTLTERFRFLMNRKNGNLSKIELEEGERLNV